MADFKTKESIDHMQLIFNQMDRIALICSNDELHVEQLARACDILVMFTKFVGDLNVDTLSGNVPQEHYYQKTMETVGKVVDALNRQGLLIKWGVIGRMETVEGEQEPAIV